MIVVGLGHLIDSSATNKLPCREIGYKQINLQRDQLHTNQRVERSARNKSPCREFSYKQINVQRDQLQTNHPLERSSRN